MANEFLLHPFLLLNLIYFFSFGSAGYAALLFFLLSCFTKWVSPFLGLSLFKVLGLFVQISQVIIVGAAEPLNETWNNPFFQEIKNQL